MRPDTLLSAIPPLPPGSDEWMCRVLLSALAAVGGWLVRHLFRRRHAGG